VICNGLRVALVIRTKTYCKGCNNKYMCSRRGATKSTMIIFIDSNIDTSTTV
jgi:hypothetical protein